MEISPEIDVPIDDNDVDVVRQVAVNDEEEKWQDLGLDTFGTGDPAA